MAHAKALDSLPAISCRNCRPAPVSDPQRLRLLACTGLLDAEPEAFFDRLTGLTRDLLDVPVALVSLVDDRRQFFISQTGLPSPWSEQRETPLSHSFCQTVVTTGNPLIVTNSEQDDRVKDNLAIPDLGVLAYAGFPIVAEGEVLGSFCAIRGKAHQWTQLELRVVREFAETVSNEVELRLQLEKQKQIQAALESSNEELEQFAQIAAHDLKEPLRGVSCCLQAMRETLVDVPPKAQVLFDHASESAAHMSNLIDSLKRYSRLGRDPIQAESLDLDWTVKRVLGDLARVVVEKNAVVEVDGSLGTAQVDPAQIRQLFQNLISNSLKFSRTDVPPHIVLSRQGDVFSVTDNGIGIDERYFERVFEVFRRLQSRQNYPGTGIGLAVCRRIVERHGGAIWLEAKEDQGSRFCFQLGGSPGQTVSQGESGSCQEA